MKQMIDNLINGNLTEAKRQAKGKSFTAIARHMRQTLGWSSEKAAKAAYYLKTGQGWQLYCDAN